MPLVYRVLGELVIGEGTDQPALPRGHRLTVLGTFLLNANRRVSTVDLLRAGWGHSDVDETQLHKCISALRTLLGDLGRRDQLVTHQRFGYELRVPEDELDKLVFERLVREAEEAGWQARIEEEIDRLRAALRLWRGQYALAGLPGVALRQDATDLEQRRKRAAVRLFELELARGRYERILDEAAMMVGYHPADRRLCEQLMIALYRAGHASEAVQAYDRYQDALEQATGAQPEVALRNLMYAIARGDNVVVARYEEAITQQPVGSGRAIMVVLPRQLPPDPADFVGRDDLIAETRWLLTREPDNAAPVVVVSGPGGIGKTALAVHVAQLVREHYADGQLFAELRGTSGQPVDPIEVLAQFLRAFGVATVPESRAERVGLYRSLAAGRRVLVVLDDAQDEAQIRDLIPGNPGCAVLVTTRARLPDIDGAHHLPALPPLEPELATKLYLRVVRRSGVNAGAEPGATQQIIELCAGLPLALCVAGALRARDPGRTATELAERLRHQRPDAFVYGERSVGRSIGAGFDRLDEPARLLFLGLGLVRLPDFGVWTAAAVLDGTGADPAEGLLRLASWNLLQPVGRGMRYNFHDLTREYARRRAETHYPDAEQRRTIPQRVYAALLTLTRRAHRRIYDGDFEVVHGGVPDWAGPPDVLAELDRAPLGWFEDERPNIRAAVAHTAELGLTEACWDLAISAHEFYTLRSYHDDWYATHQIALAACRQAGNLRGEAAMLTMLGQPALVASHRSGVSEPEDLHRAAGLFAECKDRHGQAIALRTLGNHLLRRRQHAAALARFSEALAHYIASGDLVGRWLTLRYIGQAHLDMGHYDEALRVLESAEAAASQSPRPRLLAQIRFWIGRVRLDLGDLERARADFWYVLDAIGDAEDTGRAYATFGLGEAARLAGHRIEAERYLRAAADLAHDAADAAIEGRAYQSLAMLYGAGDQIKQQIDALTRAVAAFRGSDAAYQHAAAGEALGDAYASDGAIADARTAWTEVLQIYTTIGVPDAEQIRRKLAELPGG